MSLQMTATGSFSDASTQNVTAQAAWTTDDVNALVTVGASTGLITHTTAGRIYGGSCGVTASIGAVTAASRLHVIPTESGSVAVPLRDQDWVDLGLSPWGSYWGMQEAVGSLVGSGSVPITLALAGTAPTYGTAAPDPTWARRFISGSDGLAQRFSSTVNVPVPATGLAMLTYGVYGQSGAAAHVVMGSCYTSAGNMFSLQTTTLGKLGVNCSGTQVNGTVDYRDGRVHPFLIVYDPVNLRAKLYSDLEHVTGTFSVVGGPGGALTPTVGWQQVITTLASAGVMGGYLAIATGSVATALSDDGVASATLKKLGWTPNF